MRQKFLAILTLGRSAILILAVVAVGALAAWLASQQSGAVNAPVTPVLPDGEKIVRLDAQRVSVPPAMAERLGLTIQKDSPAATVKRASEPIALPLFQGTLALDNNSLQRIHSRFAGEIVALGRIGDGSVGPSNSLVPSPGSSILKVQDRIEPGQLLAVVWSKDLGEKKSELVQAISKLKLAVLTAQRLRELYKQNGTAEKSVLDAEQQVESLRGDIDRIERTLLSWRLTEADLAKVRAEAEKIGDPTAARSSAADWARVEIRAVAGGVLLEKNIGVGDIVDTTTDLFKIGSLSPLTVWAHVYEDDLPLLAGLTTPAPWKVSIPVKPEFTYNGTLDQIGSVIDPNQHTALVSGRVENPKGELKIGQFVTVDLSRPANTLELTIPTEALLEEGKGSYVFVQPDPNQGIYERRPVVVLRRTRDFAYLRDNALPISSVLGCALSNGACVREGDRVAGSGSLLLNEAMKAAALQPAK